MNWHPGKQETFSLLGVYVSKTIIQVSPCAKVKLKRDAKGLSICVVLEEKFEHRLQIITILDRISQIEPIGNASSFCKMCIFISNKHDTWIRLNFYEKS
jgi:hypothetical protein